MNMGEEFKKPTRAELIELINTMNNDIEKLPTYALSSPITHYDFSALLILLYAVFKAED